MTGSGKTGHPCAFFTMSLLITVCLEFYGMLLCIKEKVCIIKIEIHLFRYSAAVPLFRIFWSPELIALVMQAGNSNSAQLHLALLQVSCLHYSRN